MLICFCWTLQWLTSEWNNAQQNGWLEEVLFNYQKGYIKYDILSFPVMEIKTVKENFWLGPRKRDNKKVLLRERKRHTARRVASTPTCWCGWGGYPRYAPCPDLGWGTPLPWPGKVVPPPILTWMGGYPMLLMRDPPPILTWDRVPPPPPILTWEGVPPILTWDGVPPILTWEGGTPSPVLTWDGVPLNPDLGNGFPPPPLARWGGDPSPRRCGRTDACEKNTFRIPSECGR